MPTNKYFKYLVKVEIGLDSVHKSYKAPESVNLVSVHYEEDRGQQVRHSLDVAKVEVVHHIGQEDL